MQNVDGADGLLSIAKYLKDDGAIIDFCKYQFDKELTVAVGDLPRLKIPTVKETPYIVLTDFAKKEGLNIEFNNYKFNLYVGVGSDKVEYVDDNGILIPDLYDVGSHFMTLIQDELNKRRNYDRPISSLITDGPYPVDPAGKHWAGRMTINLRINTTIGGNETL